MFKIPAEDCLKMVVYVDYISGKTFEQIATETKRELTKILEIAHELGLVR